MAKKPLTPKEEAFCLTFLETRNQSEAYRRCYDVSKDCKPETIWVNSCQLMAKANVSQRVFELEQQLTERTLVTVESITKELDENRKKADDLDQVAAMNVSSMGKANLHGLLTKQVDHKSSDRSMSPVGEIPAEERLAALLAAIKPKGTDEKPG